MKTFYKPTLEIADIFNQFDHLLSPRPFEQLKVIQAIKNCRTSVLGGHQLKCDNCEYQQVSYDILFQAASLTLKEVAKTPKNLGAEIGAIGVLHSWSQSLLDHPHIHFIVPGGGLNKSKTKWVPCKKDYFLPIHILSEVFRGKLLQAFEKAFNKGDFKFVRDIEYLNSYANFKELLMTCASKDFVVYAKKPFAGPKQVITYLGQYTHRIAISNYRLVKLEGEKVYFKVRDRKNPKQKKIMVLHVKEFMRRFLLHVLPKGYMRIRHFGMLASRTKKIKISIVRTLQGIKEQIGNKTPETWKELLKRFTGIDANQCPKCGAKDLLKTIMLRPSFNTS